MRSCFKMNMKTLSFLFFLIGKSFFLHTGKFSFRFTKVSNQIGTLMGLQCYKCSDDNGDQCSDKFNSQGYGVVQVNSSSGYCWVR